MKITTGKILPGQGIGEYKIGLDEESVLNSLNGEYVKQERDNGSSIITIENAKFWFDSNKKLIQLGVTTGFCSKYDNKIGVGDTLDDIQNKVGPFYEEHDDYLIKGINGIAFELADEGDSEWNELTLPIEWIYIFRS